MIERTTIRLPGELMDLARRRAAAEGRTLTWLIEDSVRARVMADKKTKKTKRVMPRISKATGGLMPGVDLSDSAAIQEMDDVEYVERLKRLK